MFKIFVIAFLIIMLVFLILGLMEQAKLKNLKRGQRVFIRTDNGRKPATFMHYTDQGARVDMKPFGLIDVPLKIISFYV